MPRRPKNYLTRTGTDYIVEGNEFTPVFTLRDQKGRALDRFIFKRRGKRIGKRSMWTGRSTYLKFGRRK